MSRRPEVQSRPCISRVERVHAKAFLLVLCCVFLTASGRPQLGSALGSSSVLSSAGTTVEARTIHGQVVNALTGAAVPRALVTLNSRQALTDSQGRFEFPAFGDAQASVMVIKPGYSQSAEAGEMYVQQKILDLSAAVEVKLYPDAVLSGTAAGQDGLPLSQIPISLRRANYDVSGPRWINAGFSVSNSRGEYRFVVPAGRYRLALGYSPRSRDTQEAVLPLEFPNVSSSNTLSSWIALSPGEERQIDLRPRTGDVHPMIVRVDGAGSRQNVRFTAVPGSGETINLNASPGAGQGEYRVELPVGSYSIHVQSDTREESFFGSGRVAVSDAENASLTLHLAPATSLPIEVAVDPASQSLTAGLSAVVDIAQFGLYLRDLAGGADSSNPDIPARAKEDRTFEFRVPAGRYRLGGNGGGNWYVESATYGGTANLLTGDLAIAAGSAGEAIRLVVGNVHGSVRGQVTLPAPASTAWVYFLPRQPALAMPNPQSTGADGRFFASLPAGSYVVVAFSRRVQEDLRDPETVDRLTGGAKTVEVTSGTNPVISLTLSQTPEIPR